MEGLFDKWKHDYLSHVHSRSRADDVLFEHKNYRQMLMHRFVEDYQNSKLPKGLEEVVQRYKKTYGVTVKARPVEEESNPRRPSVKLSFPKKSPRKRAVEEFPPKNNNHDNNFARQLFTDDADFNVPYEGNVSPGLSKFSKNKKIRKLQRAQIMKHYETDVQNVKMTVKNQIEERRQASNVDLDIPPNQFETADEEDCNFNILSQQMVQDDKPVKIESVLFSESSIEPNFKIWETLEALPLNENQSAEIELLPTNRFFEIEKGASAFGTVNMLFDLIRPEGDKTKIMRLAFKYGKSTSNGVLYLFIICMTNKSTRRDKKIPFVFEYVIPCVQLDPKINLNSYEGFCHIKPKKDSMHDEVAGRKKIQFDNDDFGVRKSIIETFTRDFPVDHTLPVTLEMCQTAEPEKHDKGIKPNTYVLIRIKSVKNATLAKVVTITASEVLLEILKPKNRSAVKYLKTPVKTCFHGRETILASSIPVFDDSSEVLSLYEKPNSILKKLNVLL